MVMGDARGWSSKSSLVHGAVKPWHVLFLFTVSWAVSVVGSYKIAEHIAGPSRMAIRDMVMDGIGASIILAFTVVVPEFRRSLGVLFSRPRSSPAAADLGLAYAASLAWGYGFYRAVICLPVLLFHPEAYQTLQYVEAVGPFKAEYLAFWAGAVLVAPVAEELIFRGYLLNLWAARWGMWPAVIISSLVFGLFHWERAVFAAPIGLILALVYLKYDSLWPGIFLHGAYNALASPWLLGHFFYVKHHDMIGQVSQWIPEIVVAILSIPIFVVFWQRFKPVPA